MAARAHETVHAMYRCRATFEKRKSLELRSNSIERVDYSYVALVSTASSKKACHKQDTVLRYDIRSSCSRHVSLCGEASSRGRPSIQKTGSWSDEITSCTEAKVLLVCCSGPLSCFWRGWEWARWRSSSANPRHKMRSVHEGVRFSLYLKQ